MTDFSVKKTSNTKDVNLKSNNKTEFSKLKAEYLAMKKKIAKSDFANAPVMLRSELNLLSELKRIATRDKLSSELSWIEERESSIKESLEQNSYSEVSNAYYKPVVSFSRKETKDVSEASEQTELFSELMELCKKPDGTFDENAELMLSALGKQDVGLLHVVDLLKIAKADSEEISPSYTSAIVKIADAGVKNADMYTYIDAFSQREDNSPISVDLQTLDVALGFKKAGMYSDGSVKMANLLSENFADKSQIKSSMMKLHKLGIAPDTIASLISSLAVEDVVTGQKTVSPTAIKTIANLKKSLVTTRQNEEKERHNPINLLNTLYLDIGDNTVIMKDGKVTYTSPIQGENYELAKERYDAMVTSLEDMMLLDFVSRYKDKNGEIDSKYLRIAAALRDSGVVYNQILDMVDFCLNEDGTINKNNVDSISALKKSGAMSDDILGILSACQHNVAGEYDTYDIKTACELTSAVIGGKEVCSLLPDVRQSDSVKDFVVSSSQFFIEKQRLPELLKLAKNSDSKIEDNALEIISDLEFNLLKDTTTVTDEEKFMIDTEQIIALARGKESVLSDDATGICAIMCQNGESAENIKNALHLCTNPDGEIDMKLSEILWNMGVQKSSFAEMEEALNVCTNQDKTINYNNADMILALFDSGYSKDKILALISK